MVGKEIAAVTSGIVLDNKGLFEKIKHW